MRLLPLPDRKATFGVFTGSQEPDLIAGAAVISQMVDSNVVRHRAICCISTVPEEITVFIDPKQTMRMAKC